MIVYLFQIKREFYRVIKRTAGMRRDHIGNEILIHPEFFVQFVKSLIKTPVYGKMRFSHTVEDSVGAMFGRNFQLPADMILHEFLKKLLVLILDQIIVSYAAPYKDLFDARQSPYAPKYLQILRMIGLHRGTRIRSKTASVRAKTLFVAGGMSEIRGRTADVVYIALEIRRPSYLFGFADNAVLCSRRNIASLMKNYRAEITAAETSPVMRDRMFDFRDRGNASDLIVNRVPRAHKRKVVNIVQRFPVKRNRRRVLLDPFVPVTLNERFPDKRVLLTVLNARRVRILLFACGVGTADLFVGRALDRALGLFVNDDAGSGNVRQRRNVFARRER